jgi:hypothetical protein
VASARPKRLGAARLDLGPKAEEAVKKSTMPVILSGAKDLLLFVFNEEQQMLRCA